MRTDSRIVKQLGRSVCLAVACATLLALLCAGSASANGVWWHLSPRAVPTDLQPGSTAWLVVAANNNGDIPANGATAPVTMTDALPPGLKATAVHGAAGYFAFFSWDEPEPECTLSPLQCVYKGILKPYERMWMVVEVEVSPTINPTESNAATVSGGGGPAASRQSTILADGGPAQYGAEEFTITPEEEGGAAATQAGSHPFQLTTNISFNRTARLPFFNSDESSPVQPALPKDVFVKLPPGLVGNPTPLPQCTQAQFSTKLPEDANACPDDSAVGVAKITLDEPNVLGYVSYSQPIFNLTPERGEPARFGFTVLDAPIYLDTAVRTGGDYGVDVNVSNISEVPALLESEITFWGVPGDTRHDSSRGWYCGVGEAAEFAGIPCKALEDQHPQPLLSLPTSCTGPLQASVQTDSWAQPGTFLSYAPNEAMPALDGCNRLGFEPQMKVTPDGEAASTPTGLTVDLHVPQDESLVPTGLSEANVKDTTVTLPEGLALNPAAADGLMSCSIGEIALESADAPSCPDASEVGTVTIHTPLLPDPLTGAAYLAAQNANPFGSLVALYVVAEDAKAGVLIKLAGDVHLTESGQIVSTFQNTPQLPFEDFELHFFGGDRAPLATPASCGSYTASASISPWSGNTPATPSSTFNVSSGPGGAPCASPLPFAPSLTGGMPNIQAGGFSPFTMTIGREDGQQNLDAVQLKMPAGLSGTLTGVKLCQESQADLGTCGEESLIGHTVVSVGLGGDPYSVTGGRVYLTGPYEGAPFGLSIVNPAKAGPFDLGQVVVRAKVEVDPITAALTITTDRTGPYAIPQILDGIPLQIKHVNVTIDRSAFTFNPTDCQPMQIGGSLTSSQGAASSLHVPFQVTNCATLAFKPKFAAYTSGKTSKADGASLAVKLTYPKTPQGAEANIARVKVDLPKQLPSRLTTLQKACLATTFEANPANCPAASIVGHAKATTPILPVPLEGPAYFVSHGGEAFPSLIVVLQGYGVTVDLVGSTFISKAGITSSTFKTVPDVPVGSFELTLPEGKYSALAANGNLCKSKLAMPTEFLAQNGAKINESTKLAVTGCAKAKKAKKAKHKKHGKAGRKGKR
jgi:hypothetical protein